MTNRSLLTAAILFTVTLTVFFFTVIANDKSVRDIYIVLILWIVFVAFVLNGYFLYHQRHSGDKK